MNNHPSLLREGQLSLQQVFNNALFGIRAQGYQKSDGAFGCVYGSNGLDGKEIACGIGHSFTRAEQKEMDACPFGDTSVEYMIDHGPRFVHNRLGHLSKTALTELQRIHDGMTDHYNFELSMAEYAEGWSLKYENPQ